MAVVAVTADNTRRAVATIATDTGTWGNDGGGGGVADEPDIVYQGTTSQSRKVGTTVIGRSYTHGTGLDAGAGQPGHFMMKVNATNSLALLSRSSPALHVKLGSSSSDYYSFYLFGSDNYPPRGGWQIVPISPGVSGYQDATSGSPVLTIILYFSVLGDFSTTSKSENLCIDAIDFGEGLHLVGGDGVSADGVFDDFVTYDEGTSGNRFGYVTTDAGVIFVAGRLAIGQTSAGTSTITTFIDSGKTIVWRNGLVNTGFNRFRVDLATSGTDVQLTNCSLGSEGQIDNDGDRGYTTTEDSRPIFEVTGAHASADLLMSSCVLDNFASFILNLQCDFAACVFTNSGEIDCGTGAQLNDAVISGYTGAADTSNIEWTANLDPDGDLDNIDITKGATAHHAISFGTSTPTTMTLRGLNSSGFNASNGQNDSFFHVLRTTGTVTINVVGGTGNFSYKTAGATVVVVLDTVTLDVTAIDSVTKSAIQNAYVTAWCVDSAPAGPFDPATVTITQTAGTATVTHTAHGLSTGDEVRIVGASPAAYNGFKSITVTTANAYTFAIDSGTASPADGSITSSLLLINGLTNASGVAASAARTFSTDQDYEGEVKKGTSSPVYVTGSISGTIDSGVGATATAPLVADE